jgi:hypothetical protein
LTPIDSLGILKSADEHTLLEPVFGIGALGEFAGFRFNGVLDGQPPG